jgi:hypothetical protein
MYLKEFSDYSDAAPGARVHERRVAVLVAVVDERAVPERLFHFRHVPLERPVPQLESKIKARVERKRNYERRACG